MTTNDNAKIHHLNQLLSEKETEWRSLLQQQLDSLVQELGKRDELLKLERIRFSKLKTDFEYNLNLLGERDKELEEYEKLFEKLRANDILRNSEVSEMKIRVDDANKRYDYAIKEKEELQNHYQMRLKGYQEEVNNFYFKKEQEVEDEKEDLEKMKRELLRKTREYEEEKEFNQQKMLKEFDYKLKEKAKEHQDILDDKNAELRSYQLKIKTVSKELELLRCSSQKVEDSMDDQKARSVQLERLLKQKDWELQDLKNMNKLAVKDLEDRIKKLTKNNEDREKEFHEKVGQAEKLLNDRKMMIETITTRADEKEQQLCNQLIEAKKRWEDLGTTHRNALWEHADQMKEKDLKIKSLEERLGDVESSLREEMEASSKEKVTRDLQLETLKASESHLHVEKQELRNEISQLKKDLNSSVQRERISETAKVQMEMDWRKRLESRETGIYKQHEELIRNLTVAKEDALLSLKNKENELIEQEHLLKMLQMDKNTAIKLLQKQGVDIEEVFNNNLQQDNIEEELTQQNNQLKEIIRQMSVEMESLIQNSKANSTEDNEKQFAKKSDYVVDLEDQVRDLKAKCRELHHKIEEVTKDKKPPSVPRLNVSSPFALSLVTGDGGNDIKEHIRKLNETIAFLRNEKVELTAFLATKDTQIRYLQDSLSQEKHKNQIALENMKYDFQSHDQSEQQTVRLLNNRICHLELQLAQARSEADVYYKSVLKSNMDVGNISLQLSDMKIGKITNGNEDGEDSKAEEVHRLKVKLKFAVRKIKELAAEREKLIEIGNKLRAQLSAQHGTQAPIQPDEIEESVPAVKERMTRLKNKLNNKLQALEQLHYDVETKRMNDKMMQDEKSKQSTALQNVVVNLKNPSFDNSFEEQELQSTKSKPVSPTLTLRTSSSDHSSTLKEIWKLLEQDDISVVSSNSRYSPTTNEKHSSVTRHNVSTKQEYAIVTCDTSSPLRKGISPTNERGHSPSNQFRKLRSDTKRSEIDEGIIGQHLKGQVRQLQFKSNAISTKNQNQRKKENKPKVRNYNLK